MRGFSRIAFTPAVKAVQERLGSRATYARAERGATEPDLLGPDEFDFSGQRDSFSTHRGNDEEPNAQAHRHRHWS
jgi:uncharacterized protein